MSQWGRRANGKVLVFIQGHRTHFSLLVGWTAAALVLLQHCPFPAEEPGPLSPQVPKLAVQYKEATAKLVKVLKKKYGESPTVTERPLPEESEGGAEQATGDGKGKGGGKSGGSLSGASVDELREELRRREQAEVEEGGGTPFTSLLDAPPSTSAEAPAKVVVVGGGPAGLSAALYAARAGLSPIVIAPMEGGQLLGKGVEVENFPAAVDRDGGAPTGPAIVEAMRKQVGAASLPAAPT